VNLVTGSPIASITTFELVLCQMLIRIPAAGMDEAQVDSSDPRLKQPFKT